MEYDDICEVYDLFYNDKKYSAECEYLHALIGKYGNGGKMVLDIACGTGRHMEGLRKIGYRVNGLDCSEGMLKIASDRNPDSLFYRLKMQDMKLTETYDVMICMFNAFGYLVENKAYADFLVNVWTQLNPGGLLLFDFRNGIQVLKEGYQKETKEEKNVEGVIIKKESKHQVDEFRSVFVSEHRLSVSRAFFEEKKIVEKHTMRYFFPQELGFMMDFTGLRMNILSFMKMEELGNSYQGMMVARR